MEIQYLSSKQVANYLACHLSYVQQECQRAAKGKKSKFPNSFKQGRDWVIPESDLKQL